MKTKYKVALAIVGILILGHVYIGYSYSMWVKSFETTQTNTVTSGCFTITFEEKTKSISLTNTYPVTDATALAKIKPYKIKITNTCDATDAGYSITLNTVELAAGKTKLDDKFIKVAVGIGEGDVGVVKPTSGALLKNSDGSANLEINTETANLDVSGTLLTSYIINTGYITKGSSKTFDIYLWLDESATTEVAGQSFEAGISVLTYSASSSSLAKTIQDDVTEENPNLPQTYSLNEEYRYTGANPNNYIMFNNELWRIIGLVNTPNGQKVKIIRNDSLMGNTQMSETGGNSWETSKVSTYYNSDYYAAIDETTKRQMDTTTWKLGSGDYITNGTLQNWKDYDEQATNSWNGYIGMLSPIDYGQGTNNIACYELNLSNYSNTEGCVTQNWLFTGAPMWLMNPSTTDTNNYIMINAEGNITEQNSTLTANEKPVVYLKTNLVIEGGTGNIGNPYRIKK